MEKKIINKNDPKSILKIVFMATGFLTALLAFIFLGLEFGVGVMTPFDEIPDPQKTQAWIDFANVTRQFATAPIILGLITGLVMFAYSILKIIAIDKKNLKEEILISAINFIVAILLFVFAIVTITSVFDTDKWTTYLNYNSMAIIFVASLTAAITSAITMTKSWANQSQLNASYRGIALTTAIITFAASIVVILTVASAGCNNEVLDGNETLMKIYLGVSFTSGCTAAMLGGSAILLLIMIVHAVFKANQGEIIRWAITGGLAFALFIAFAVFCPTAKDGTRWGDNHMTASGLCALSWISLMVGGIMALVQTKRIIDPRVKSKPAIKAK